MAIPDVVMATVAAATPPAESRTDKLAAKKGALAAKRGALAAKKESHASETPSAPPDAAPAVKADTPAETATTPAALVPIVAAPAAPESRTDKLAAKKSALAAKRGVLASKKESYAATDALQTSEPAAAVSSSSGGGGSSGGVLGSYSMIETIGQGSYAVVRCAHNLAAASNGFPETVAIKTIDVAKVSQHAQLPEVEAEVALLRSLDHPYIATLYESVSDPLKQEMSLVMEYAAGGELYALIEKGGAIAEEEAALILAEIIDVLGYLHAKSIVHNDVKPENVCFLAEGDSIRLIDFGYAATVRPDVARGKSWCGTPKYVSPEQISGTGFESTAPDMWALGVTLYTMLCAFPPWSAADGADLQAQILNARFEFPSPWWDAISDDAKDMVRGLLTVDYQQRLTAKRAAEHRWITANT